MEEINVLIQATKDLKFFQNLPKTKKKNDVAFEICSHLSYESMSAGSTVFFAGIKNFLISLFLGEPPSKFYIILSGSVVVMKLKDEKVLQKEIETYSERLKAEAKGKARRNILPNYFPKNANLSKITSIFPVIENEAQFQQLCNAFGGTLVNLIEEPSKFFKNCVPKYNAVISLTKGMIFGELGLLRKKTRNATILCTEPCQFAILTADTYRNILASAEKEKLNKKISFLQKYIFQNYLSYNEMMVCCYDFSKAKYKNTYLFHENEPVTELFILRKGEVVVFFSHTLLHFS